MTWIARKGKLSRTCHEDSDFGRLSLFCIQNN